MFEYVKNENLPETWLHETIYGGPTFSCEAQERVQWVDCLIQGNPGPAGISEPGIGAREGPIMALLHWHTFLSFFLFLFYRVALSQASSGCLLI